MSTTLVKPAEVERKWYLLDATGKSLGHVAAEPLFCCAASRRSTTPPMSIAAITSLSSTATRQF